MTSPRDLPPTVVVGRIVKPHGLRGEVVVEVLSDVPERLTRGSELLVAWEPPAAAAPGAPRRLTVEASRPGRSQGGAVLVRFAGLADRDAAEGLRGAWLEVERASVPAAEPGTYYHWELLGCRCRDVTAGDLGEVVEVVEDGGGLLLVVSDGTRQVPVPFVESFLRSIDVAAGVIEVDLPPGLLETCASTS